MNLSTQPYKGTRDFYPEDQRLQEAMIRVMRRSAESFGFEEYNGPMLEPFELYAAKTGEEIVNAQLYWMMDRGERKMAIRPEMTPTLARMVAGRLQELPKPIRWYSIPNLWRYERPQKGRLREHWQLNVDVLGGDSVLADAEVLRLAHGVFAGFDAADKIQIRINDRRLMDHILSDTLGLNPDQSKGLMKALDARDKMEPEKFEAWFQQLGLSLDVLKRLDGLLMLPFHQLRTKLPKDWTEPLAKLFAELLQNPRDEEIFVFDARIMRGMDYYTGTVFEAYDVSPENRRALFGGGRYDNLVGLFSKSQLSGVGFGLGDVTLKDFLETHKRLPQVDHMKDLFLVRLEQSEMPVLRAALQQLRNEGFSCIESLESVGLGAQLKVAAKLNCRFALIQGADEVAATSVSVKNLLTGSQDLVSLSQLASFMTSKLLKSKNTES